jgi:SpoVK/Ycf46/Vps4 family AAA+-type ATPase
MTILSDTYDVTDIYESPDDFLEDELIRLDVAIEFEMERMHASMVWEDSPLDQNYRGMYMTPSEAKALLGEDWKDAGRTPDQESLLRQLDLRIRARLNKTRSTGRQLPVFALQDSFHLSEQEIRVLIAALAPHLHRKYLKLYAYLHDDMTRQHVTLELLLRLCCSTREERAAIHEQVTSPTGRLRPFFVRSRADSVQESSLILQPLRLTSRMIHFLQGMMWSYADGPLSSIRLYPAPDNRGLPPPRINHNLQRRLTASALRHRNSGDAAWWLLQGPSGSGKTFHARHVCGELDLSLLEWDAAYAPEDEDAFRETVELLLLEARLHKAALAIDHIDALTPSGNSTDRRLAWLLGQLDNWQGLLFLFSGPGFKLPLLPARAKCITETVPVPDLAISRNLWLELASEKMPVSDAAANLLASKFRLTPGQMEATVDAARRLKEWRSIPDSAEGSDREGHDRLLHQAAYQLVQHRLSDKTVKLEPKFGWEDLILPAETVQLLRQACMRLAHRHTVMHEWGFERKLPYGKGVSMLFTGPPGTGKTMSAMVMARAMDAELYRIDLSRVVSKYIGETEKNLSDIFEQASLSGAILFFDEADALFGKRSEVKDAHDKYANMETSYLLQKMEEYDGLTILATNFAQNIDEAFTRRIQYIVKFPFPDARQRELLWKTAIPPEMPVEELDFPFLSQTFELTGGPIKNIVLTAAYMAAEEGAPVSMKHMIEAVIQEYKKTGKLFPKDRLGSYSAYWKG